MQVWEGPLDEDGKPHGVVSGAISQAFFFSNVTFPQDMLGKTYVA